MTSNVKAMRVADRDHDIYASTVKFINVKKVSPVGDLVNLLTNIIKQNSRGGQTVLVNAKTSPNVIEYSVTSKRVAVALAHRAQRAFKHYKPEVTITTPHDRLFHRITVTFN